MVSRRGFGRAVIGIGISIVALFLVVRSVDLAATWNTIITAQPTTNSAASAPADSVLPTRVMTLIILGRRRTREKVAFCVRGIHVRRGQAR